MSNKLILIALIALTFSCPEAVQGDQGPKQYIIQAEYYPAFDNFDITVLLHDSRLGPSGGYRQDTATVSVNDIDFSISNPSFNSYDTPASPLSINSGDTLTLKVAIDGISTETSIVMPNYPDLNSPAFGSNFDAGADLTLNFGPLTHSPDSIEISIVSFFTASGSDYEASAAGNATSWVIPAGTAATDSFVSVSIDSLAEAQITGSRILGSSYFRTKPGIDLSLTSNP
jgi:hypothetical protein